MKIYRIYSDKEPDCMFPSSLIKDVMVIANSEEQALDIVKKRYENYFVCDFEEVNIVAVSGESGEIINVEYFNDSHY
jgi:hypothetical protein